jgi:riboflavin biosynthesis pyrimidine reductase
MIASMDGATAVAGLSGGLDGVADRALFAVLRSQADDVLAAAGLLDELCVTVSPLLAGGDAKRILAGSALVSGPGWRLHSLCE